MTQHLNRPEALLKLVTKHPLYKKWSFLLKIYSLNVTKSAGNHPMGVLHSFSIKNHFFVNFDIILWIFYVKKYRSFCGLLLFSKLFDDNSQNPIFILKVFKSICWRKIFCYYFNSSSVVLHMDTRMSLLQHIDLKNQSQHILSKRRDHCTTKEVFH